MKLFNVPGQQITIFLPDNGQHGQGDNMDKCCSNCGEINVRICGLLKSFKMAIPEISRENQLKKAACSMSYPATGLRNNRLSIRNLRMMMGYGSVQQREAVSDKNDEEPSPGFHAAKIGKSVDNWQLAVDNSFKYAKGNQLTIGQLAVDNSFKYASREIS